MIRIIIIFTCTLVVNDIPKTEYKLTRFGQTLTPLILEMEKWGRIYNTINLE